jgi:hypothetical protein
VHGWGITDPGRASTVLMHVADWAPTLLAAAGVLSPTAWPPAGWANGDGVNVWDELRQTHVGGSQLTHGPASPPASQRTEVLLNIDHVTGSAALRVGPYKIVRGMVEAAEGGWYTGVAGLKRGPSILAGGSVDCGATPPSASSACEPGTVAGGWCLFNIEKDPCERVDLSTTMPEVVTRLAARLESGYNQSAVPCLNDPIHNPNALWWPAAHPDNFGGRWAVWAE